ncbi:MAG TPA: NADH-quinone oxidoreductase subunit A [Bryobacteraceae bacterium]|nr:NADH-quinone oxidoreductase subunit A [Bryobacteraceae bacterium]
MPTNYYEVYFPVLVQVILAAAVACGLVGGGLLLGKRVRTTAKDTPYESGMIPTGNARERFSVKFYLVAMVFILFDIEAIFLYPWAVVYRKLGMFAFVEMLIFIVLVLAGFFYIWKKGVLDWSQEAMDAFKESETATLGGGYTLSDVSAPEPAATGRVTRI